MLAALSAVLLYSVPFAVVPKTFAVVPKTFSAEVFSDAIISTGPLEWLLKDRPNLLSF